MSQTPPAKLLRDEIYGMIRQSVLTCEIPPGASLREQELAERFGVSKSPVRDALHRLQVEGLVEVLPRKGYRVKAISLEDALELYEMRMILECAGVERTIRAASNYDLSTLDIYRHGPTTRTRREWIDYNRRFHLAVGALSGNNRLIDSTKDIILAFDRLTSASLSQLQSETTRGAAIFERMDREHSDIITALQARNTRRAVSLMQSHIETSRNRFLESYNSPPRAMAFDPDEAEVRSALGRK